MDVDFVLVLGFAFGVRVRFLMFDVDVDQHVGWWFGGVVLELCCGVDFYLEL